jgi:hypothetical protein
MNFELEMVYKGEIVACYKKLSQRLLGTTNKNHKSLSESPASKPASVPGISQVHTGVLKHLIAKLGGIV